MTGPCTVPNKRVRRSNALLRAQVSDESIWSGMALEVTHVEDSIAGAYVASPSWEQVEMRIEIAFSFGGTVSLHRGLLRGKQRADLCSHEYFAMQSEFGRYRMLFARQLVQKGGRLNLHEWWEDPRALYRGVARLGGVECDARSVCTDIEHAKRLFAMYLNGGSCNPLRLADPDSGWRIIPAGDPKNHPIFACEAEGSL